MNDDKFEKAREECVNKVFQNSVGKRRSDRSVLDEAFDSGRHYALTEDVRELVEALRAYESIENLASLGCNPTIGANNKIASETLAKFDELVKKVGAE